MDFSSPKGQALIALAVILGIILIFLYLSRVSPKRSADGRQPSLPKAPVPFAKAIPETASSAGVGFAGLMLIVFSFVSAGVYAGATTVFQEIVALLIWIGSSTFWGIFIIAGMAGRRTTYIVYSESALNAERNIARLEKMYEQLNSQQLHALETSEREAISKIPPT